MNPLIKDPPPRTARSRAQKRKRREAQARRVGLRLVKRFEGFSPVPYKVGPFEEHYTWGYGDYGPHVPHPSSGKRISEAEASRRLERRLNEFLAGVDRLVKVPLTSFQRWALGIFAYNVGLGAFEDSTLLRKLNQGRYRAVPRQLMRWVLAGGAVLQGLVRRRRAEGRLWSRKPRKRRKR